MLLSQLRMSLRSASAPEYTTLETGDAEECYRRILHIGRWKYYMLHNAPAWLY